MGSGTWTNTAFTNYVRSTSISRGYSATIDSSGTIVTNASNQDMFKATCVDPVLNPRGVTRECRDSDEHPNTLPVILALDVTGSMGEAAVEVAKKLNTIMTKLYDEGNDIEFMIMGIGDLYCDAGPIQISQFESDIRIAEQLDKVWFEFGGGGNDSESYTAAWYMGSRHCDLDCWGRGQKGIIITMGDERCNPWLPQNALERVTGDTLQGSIETKDLYKEVTEKFNVYHIQVEHSSRIWDKEGIRKSWSFIGDHYREANMDNIANEIVDIITCDKYESVVVKDEEGISW